MEHVFSGDDLLQWKHGGLSIWYTGNLNGGGTIEAPWFVSCIRGTYPGRRFRRALDWCGGCGFVGFSLLREGICEDLCITDINPGAIACVERTIADNRSVLGGHRINAYVSDNLRSIPETEVFDLVVGNPPYAHALNTEVFGMAEDLRPHDPGWRIHETFYANIDRYLLPGAVLCISAFEPFEKNAYYFPGDPRGVWDVRPRPPIQDFRSQIEAGGLELRGVVQPAGSLRWFWIVVSEKPHPVRGCSHPGGSGD